MRVRREQFCPAADYLTGILEVSGAIGMLLPRFRLWAALQIAAVMVRATITNLAILHLPRETRLTAGLLVAAVVLAWLCRQQSEQRSRAARKAV
jgi:putative oxidoreductase